ncbi:endopeptidase La [Patescibacteria group bacterium]|nr:endopeptidase La [Patescibacteria group bacterium]
MAILLNKLPGENQTKRFPLVAIREGVVFPHTEQVLVFGRKKSVAGVTSAFETDRQIVFVTQKNASIADPSPEHLYKIGALSLIERTLKSDGEINAIVKGVNRVRILDIDTSGEYMLAEVASLPEIEEQSQQIEAVCKHITNEFKKAVNLGKSVEFLSFMKLMGDVKPSELADQIASTLDIKSQEKQELLEMLNVRERLEKVLDHLTHEIKVLEIERKIATKTQKKFDKSMREAVLRERMKTIQHELGEGVEDDEETKVLKKKIMEAKMPKVAREKAEKELKRLSQMSAHNPEAGYIRTWLETIVEMPWSKRTANNVSIKHAQKVLDGDHYGLKEVKERILEYLAVLKIKEKAPKKTKLKAALGAKEKSETDDHGMPTILCFVGPPGVGKTSIGRSIARALGRKFIKISLGGIRDEAEIRGHRRTYVGAMPGRIIQGIRTAGSKNPVFMLDEIDKVGTDFRGDPSAALLEALDPEQNKDFSDHYIEVPFDLSEVMFITTGNVLDTIPPALRDRLEVIRFSGYTEDEKYHIAKHHLIEKVLRANGLTKGKIEIPAATLRRLIKRYTREAGVRNLERELAKMCRKVARKIAEGEKGKINITTKTLSQYLGPEKFSETLAEEKDEVGLATGLAFTQAGGDILFVEVALMPGKGRLILTGKLGDVMKESGRAALSYVRSRWKELKLEKDFHKSIDVHIHVPEGAVPKDGPSAGVTITTALVSALTKRATKREVAMTGEVTLRGRILEIGGVKEKIISAHRAGLKEVILPKDNKKDLVDVPDHVKRDLKFHYITHMDEVLKIALKGSKIT